jgi:hypothetical protein
MAEDIGKILPLFVNTDQAYDKLKPEEAPHIKGYTWDINSNPENGIGTNNSSEEGQNLYALSPAKSNSPVPGVELPTEGWNKNMGSFESVNTNDLFYFNYNSESNHGIYILSGDSGVWQKVIEDPKLAFVANQEGFIAGLRVALRLVKDKDGNITEKHLMWTDGKKWQGWVNVIAAIATDGFNESLFPYWSLRPPHFDREELLEWPVRPPMIKPIATPIENTAADQGKINRMVDRAFRYAIAYVNTDGRISTASPYSLPYLTRSEEYLNNPDNLPKKAELTLAAGSPLTERIMILVSECESGNPLDPLAVWSDFVLYDTINKFNTSAEGSYWTRQNAWENNDYNIEFNTIKYTFDNSKVGSIISQSIMRLQNDMPQVSQCLTDVDDAVLLINNRYDYNNFSKESLDKLSASIVEKEVPICSKPLRKMYVYAYVGMATSDFAYVSQVGYKMGDDPQVRFGGLRPGQNISGNTQAYINVNESTFFKLDFADRSAFRCYLKGTPFYADGKWFQVNSDNSLVEIQEILDLSRADVLEYVQTVFSDGGYFVCRFEFTVPADRYIATIGRHDVPSSGDYRSKSTYIYGIANSRQKSVTEIPGILFNDPFYLTSIKPNAIVRNSKEMALDCTAGDVDVWGNNQDLFYIYCPYNLFRSGQGRYRFIEGYFRESSDNERPVELFPYRLYQDARDVTDDCGVFTDKNGFYWGYTKVQESDDTNVLFAARMNCAFPRFFTIQTSQAGIGWCQNAPAYLSDNNNGEVGDCNRVLLNGRITNIGGTVGYSNIAISILDGETVYTDQDGRFTLIIHNGRQNNRSSNIYVNAGSNFLITLANCGQIPITSYSESLIECIDCNERVYPVELNMEVLIQSSNQISLKEGGKYNVGIVGADLAGRLTYVNPFEELEVQTFLQRDNINATFIRMLIDPTFNLLTENPDIKWVAPYVSRNVSSKRWVEWVGDRIVYLDNSGNEVTDPSSAVFAKIIIQSLYDSNRVNNFSLLSKYQFAKDDRIYIKDDGDGNLFDVATFGSPIDLQVLGTDYNQAAINAGLLPPQSNTVLDNNNQTTSEDIGIIVRYDQRLDRLSEKTGFWIEIYTPTKSNDIIPFMEMGGFYPVINGQVVQYTGMDNGQPAYEPLVSIDIDFWDTYYLQRSIEGKFFNHPFQSPNVSDNWGANLTSGGRINVENKEARQMWLGGDTARSDSFMKTGNVNGLATFKKENRKNFGIYPFGEIIASNTIRNTIIFICRNDWFPASYNMPYSRVVNGQLVVTNLDDNLSQPLQKTGEYGIEKRDIGTIVTDGDMIYWYDSKNNAFVKCNYSSAVDVSKQDGNERGGMQSYLSAKTEYVNKWNNDADDKDKFDVIAGIDSERGKIYLTFRPRRNNSNDPSSYVTQRRGWDIKHQETLVYDTHHSGWVPCANFTPEAYCRLRGSWANVEFISFAAGVPYVHNNLPEVSFLNYYGVQTEPVFTLVLNKSSDVVKIMKAVTQNINGSRLFIDMLYDTQQDCYSYIPDNYWKQKDKMPYSEIQRNMVSYPPTSHQELFRSMLVDGKRIFGTYAVCRFVQRYEDLGSYFQLSSVRYLFTNSFTNKP